ncbi:MAG: RNA polymerase sigma-70 factor (ECF subfamily) [Myxococcota bacterium]|jgi:RNA polymerase sigma-70 factor (ECF subfamily)
MPLANSARDDQTQDLLDIAATAHGEAAAIGRLYDRYAPLMLAVGMKILRDRSEAEDVMHDVFVEAWRRAGDYNPGRGSVRTWLLLRMRCRALDRVRSASYARRASIDEDTDAKLEDAFQRFGRRITVEPDAAVDSARLQKKVIELPEGQRQVLELGYFQGLSSSEIASELGIPIGTVKSRVRLALAVLRKSMGVHV